MIEKLVQATISSLGYLENGVYFREPDCFDNIRDLIRLLHQDDKNKHTVRRICAERNIVKNDLVPILKSDDISDELFDATLRAKTYFDQEWEDRSEKQKLVVERTFVLIRYVFAIGAEGGHIKVSEADKRTKQKVLLNFFESDFPSLLLRLAQSPMEKEFGLHVLSIIALIFKNFDPPSLAMSETELRFKTKEKLEAKLSTLVESKKQEELSLRRVSQRSFLRGSFAMKGVKALNTDNDLVLKKSPAVGNLSPLERLSKRKKSATVRKNRRVSNLEDSELENAPNVNSQLLSAVKDFCMQFLDEYYNKLMRTTRDMAFSGGRSLTHKYSEIYFLSLTSFMMQFARLSKYPVGKVSSTFSTEFFYHVLSFVNSEVENMKLDRENIKTHALKLQYTVSVYRELIMMLHVLMNDEKQQELFKMLCDHIFQLEEYRDLGYSLLGNLTATSVTKRMLEDLILANHYYLHIIETVNKRGELKAIKKAKRRKRKSKREQKKSEKSRKINDKPLSESALEEIWTEIAANLSSCLMGEIESNEEISPINALLDVDDEQHQAFAMLHIQSALRNKCVTDAVGLYRTSRILWPETGVFGEEDIMPENEFLEMNQLFHMELQEVAAAYKESMLKAYGPEKENNADTQNEDNEEFGSEASDDEIMDEHSRYEVSEVPFDFEEYVGYFSKPHMLLWYIFLLKKFETNSVELNKSLLKILHRIAFELKRPVRLYMASLFRIFDRVNKIISRVPEEDRKEHKFYDLYQFGFHLFKKFLKHYKDQGSLLICELLFTKTFCDEVEIEDSKAK
ncbi:timeless protein domain-containing protein [Ditylenchus destructor]|uniref:Timeless protein domain-containing protein n=1 Tax=Ditylenchus destructor TaxID=166010 RepID=A0AAD4NEA0_9BILA|nr:timeless protein domain-containing protein [Ditylenchus destructor]